MDLQITKYCTIKKGEIQVNGKSIFSDQSRENLKEFAIEAYKRTYITYPKFFKMDKLSKLGFLASELLLRDGIDRDVPKPEMAVVLMNSSASLDTDETYQKTIQPGEDYFPSPSVFVYTLPNIVIGEICIRQKIQGENTFFVSEQFKAESLYNYVQQLFATSNTQSCLCGWLELKNEDYFAYLMLVEAQKDADKTIFETNTINNLFKRL
jgi:hypothetical protein